MGFRSGTTDESEHHRNKQTDIKVCLMQPASLTFTHSTLLFISWIAKTFTNRNQPLSISTAVHFRLLFLLWLVDTRPSDLHKGGSVSPSNGIGEGCQVTDGERAGFVENPDRNQGDAGADVLEGQVETLPVRDLHISHLSVQFHNAVSNVHLDKKRKESMKCAANCVNLPVQLKVGVLVEPWLSSIWLSFRLMFIDYKS